jgi:hypothetical protein
MDSPRLDENLAAIHRLKRHDRGTEDISLHIESLNANELPHVVRGVRERFGSEIEPNHLAWGKRQYRFVKEGQISSPKNTAWWYSLL